MKSKFVPNICLENNKKIQKYRCGKLKILIVILIVLNLILVKSNLDLYKLQMRDEIEVNSTYKIKKNVKSVDNIKNLELNNVMEKLDIKQARIDNDKIELDIFVENKKEYINVVSIIEKNYSIKSLSPIIDENDKKFIKVII